MCANSQWQIRYLRCFEAVIGLKVNFGKRSLIEIGEIPNIDMLVADLGCRVGSLPTTYLGLPLEASFKRTDVWNPVVERIQRRLSGWKANYLSKLGRMTFLKAAFANIPIYFDTVQFTKITGAKN